MLVIESMSQGSHGVRGALTHQLLDPVPGLVQALLIHIHQAILPRHGTAVEPDQVELLLVS